MAETTFLVGAGINRVVRSRLGLVPPLSKDFFRQALAHPRLSAPFLQPRLSPLFDFIKRYWRLERADLVTADLDLEECFTFAELRRREAYVHGDRDGLAAATQIQLLLTDLLLEYLAEFELPMNQSKTFNDFAALIYRERASVLTFNYDTMLEAQIEQASPVNENAIKAYMVRQAMTDRNVQSLATSLSQQGVTPLEIHDKTDSLLSDVADEDVGFSHHQWNRWLAYSVRFDDVALLTPGPTRMVPGERYYQHQSHSSDIPPFLKLHGSLGWFVRSGYWLDGTPLSNAEASEGKTVALRASHHQIGLPAMDLSRGEILLPLIITPVLDKPYNAIPLLDAIWSRARQELTQCKRLVIGGYSFPSTDFHVRFLLREAFSDRGPKELCVINPDTSVIGVAKDLCNYAGPVLTCSNLDEFMKRTS